MLSVPCVISQSKRTGSTMGELAATLAGENSCLGLNMFPNGKLCNCALIYV